MPRPGASPVVRRELEEWFAADARRRLHRRRPGRPAGARPGRVRLLAPTCACPAPPGARSRSATSPTRRTSASSSTCCRPGWAKVSRAAPPVIHSHAYGPCDQVRRWFDEFRALHEVYGWTAPANPRTIAGTARRRAAAPRELAYHLGREVTAAVATRADRLPPALRRGLSLERRP